MPFLLGNRGSGKWSVPSSFFPRTPVVLIGCTSAEMCGLLHPIGPLLTTMVVLRRPQGVIEPLLWGGTIGRNPDAADHSRPFLSLPFLAASQDRVTGVDRRQHQLSASLAGPS